MYMYICVCIYVYVYPISYLVVLHYTPPCLIILTYFCWFLSPFTSQLCSHKMMFDVIRLTMNIIGDWVTIVSQHHPSKSSFLLAIHMNYRGFPKIENTTKSSIYRAIFPYKQTIFASPHGYGTPQFRVAQPKTRHQMHLSLLKKGF